MYWSSARGKIYYAYWITTNGEEAFITNVQYCSQVLYIAQTNKRILSQIRYFTFEI